jgi:hypothetical protein
MSHCRNSLSKITLKIIDHLSIWNFNFSKKEQIIQSYTFPNNCIFVFLSVCYWFSEIFRLISIAILKYNLASLHLRSPWEWILFLTESCLWITFFCFKNGLLFTWNINQWGRWRKWEHKWLLEKGKFNIAMTANEVLGKGKPINNEQSFDIECEEIN